MELGKVNARTRGVITFLICSIFLTTMISYGQISTSQTIDSTGFVNTTGSNYSYTVWKDGIYTVLSNSGGEIARNTNAITIINQAITLANAISGSVLIMNGTYSLNSNVNMKSNTAIYLQLGVTLNVTAFAPTSRQGDINFNGVTNAEFVTATNPTSESSYPRVIGAATSNDECGVFMGGGTAYCTVGKIAFSHIGGYGICLLNANHNVFNGTYVHGFVKVSGGYHQGVTIRWGSYNQMINVHADGENNPNDEEVCYFGSEGPVTYNQLIGGIYERAGTSHAIYWCADSTSHPVDHNTAIGGISRRCRSQSYSCGFKLNPTTNCFVNWTIIDCNAGLELGDGGPSGNHGNIIYIVVRNCRKGGESWLQTNTNIQNNEVHLDVDVNSSLPATGEVGYTGFDFGGFQSSGVGYIQNNTIYVRARNCQYGVVFAGWDQPMTATRQAIYNKFYLDVDAISKYAIMWESSSGGYGTYNTFYGHWHSTTAGNCGSIPNANYVYTDNTGWMTNIATNTFSPG